MTKETETDHRKTATERGETETSATAATHEAEAAVRKDKAKPGAKKKADGAKPDGPKTESETGGAKAKPEKKSKEQPKAKVIQVPAFLLEPSLIPGEKRKDYDERLEDILAAFMPQDYGEVIQLKESADNIWEARRARQMRGRFIEAVQSDAHNRAAARNARGDPARRRRRIVP